MGAGTMQSVFLTCNGKSERYGNLGPKWKITTRDGQCLASLALSGLDGNFQVYAVINEEEDAEQAYNLIRRRNEHLKVTIVQVPETKNPVETVLAALEVTNHNGPLCVRDCDNYVAVEIPDYGNFTVYGKVEKYPEVQAANKSYILTATHPSTNKVIGIAENKLLSNMFNVGVYGFDSLEEFKQFCPGQTTMAGIIYEAILFNCHFYAIEAKQFEDWGTGKDWRANRKKGGTIFCDIDGVLIHEIGERKGERIQENIDFLNKLQSVGHYKLILTTCRDAYEREATLRQLDGLKFDELIMNLPRGRRILVNDIWEKRGEKSAIAITLPQNSEHLKEWFQSEGIEI